MIQLDATYEMATLRQRDLIAIARPSVLSPISPAPLRRIRAVLAAGIHAIEALAAPRPQQSPQAQA